MVDLKSVLLAVSETACYDAVSPHWEDSVATLPADGPPFLEAQAIRKHRELAGIEASVDSDLESCAERIRVSAELRALAWHCYCWTYTYSDVGRMQGWPDFEAVLGELGGVVYLIVTLAMVPLIQQANDRLSVPPEIIQQTFSGAASFLDRYRKGHGGRNGVVKAEMWWLRNYTTGNILRIGRFEYRPYAFRGQVRVYR
ncbi:MAG TPA: acyltransferase domain-containing protein, partial [Spirochaetia bacterium]|nr:acyltransferase domain-containing protein [Spirochaetia bacterium]